MTTENRTMAEQEEFLICQFNDTDDPKVAVELLEKILVLQVGQMTAELHEPPPDEPIVISD